MNTDEILAEPVYKDWFEQTFGMDPPHNNSMLSYLETLRGADVKDRIIGCTTILASHRAFERIFVRLSAAMKIWMHTFARDLRHRDVRTAPYSFPCRRVFFELADHEEGFCKDEQFLMGHNEGEQPIEEDNPCQKEADLTVGGKNASGSWKTLCPEA